MSGHILTPNFGIIASEGDCNYPSSIVLRYLFEDNCNDSIKNNNGTPSNINYVDDGDKRAAVFNGINSYIDIPDSIGNFFDDDFTLFLRVKLNIVTGPAAFHILSIRKNSNLIIDIYNGNLRVIMEGAVRMAAAISVGSYTNVIVRRSLMLGMELLFGITSKDTDTYNGVPDDMNINTIGSNRIYTDLLDGIISEIALFNEWLSNDELSLII